MLKQVRGALHRVMALFLAVPLVLAFALWGVPELRSMTQRAPLRVGDVGFSNKTLTDEYNRQMTARRNQNNGVYTREQAMADGLPDYVISSIATRSVLKQEAGKMGLIMPRKLVSEYLQKDERFVNPVTGKLDETELTGILQANGLTVTQFEEIIKDDLLRDQLINSVAAAGPAPAEMAKLMLLREVERRRVGYLTITDEMAGIPAEPTPDALNAYYEENKQEFFAPEYRSFTTVLLRYDDFKEGLEAPEEDLRRLYEANKARLYESPEKRTLYQITYDTEGEADAAVAALQQGKPFEELATEKGLTLAAVTFTDIDKGDVLDPKVAEAAFSAELKEGEVTKPVKGLFGWTIVQLAGVKAPETQSFEDVRDELASQYLEQDTRKRVLDMIDKLEEARDTGASLVAAAEEAGVRPQHFGPIDSFSMAPGGAIVNGIPGEVISEAFKLEEGEESNATDLTDGGYFFVQVDEVTPPAARPFDDVVDEVTSRWRAADRRKRISDAVKQVTDAIEAGKTFEEAAAPFNRAVLERVLDRRSADEVVSQALLGKAFTADQGAVVTGPAGSGDAQTIVEIRQIGYARSQVGPGEQTAYQQYLSYQLNQEYLEAYVDALRDEYGIKTDQNAIAQIFNEGQ